MSDDRNDGIRYYARAIYEIRELVGEGTGAVSGAAILDILQKNNIQ